MNCYLHTITAVSMKVKEENLIIESTNGTIATPHHAIEHININTVGITTARLTRAATAFNAAMADMTVCDLCPNGTGEGWICDFCKKNLCSACATLHDCAEPGHDRNGQHKTPPEKLIEAAKNAADN